LRFALFLKSVLAAKYGAPKRKYSRNVGKNRLPQRPAKPIGTDKPIVLATSAKAMPAIGIRQIRESGQKNHLRFPVIIAAFDL